MENEFVSILNALEKNREAVLERTVDGTTYKRAFSLPERLILLGGGHVSQAVARFASMLDFDVTVVDDRAAFANEGKFPEAQKIICEEFVTAIQEKLSIQSGDYVCVLTRGHQWDAECLRAILPGTMPFYLGMIGSRRRVTGLLQLLEEEGFSPERLSRIHTPIGLRINASTPQEIAVSIIAEMILVRRSRPIDKTILEQTNADMDMLRFMADRQTPKASLLVLATRGSTPAKTGAMMTIDLQGRTYGTVGGGCSENEAIRKAMQLIGTGQSESLEIDLTNEVAAEEGMVCGGTMKLLIEDLPTDTKESVGFRVSDE